MTAREYLENKYPQMRGDKWNTHDVIDDNWVAQMMSEFADIKCKNQPSSRTLTDLLNRSIALLKKTTEYEALESFKVDVDGIESTCNSISN